MPKTYGLTGYGQMMTDRVRMAAYEEALRSAIKPGCIVLDIGAGTGILSLMACRLGARRVHAVEPSQWIDTGRRIAADNGFADRIEFHRCLSTQLELPQKADVIVSDLRGILPLFESHLSAIRDARERLLAPGGALIPSADTLWVAAVEDAETYRQFDEPWASNELGFDLRAARSSAVNDWHKSRIKPSQLITPAARWGRIDYRTACSTPFSGRAELPVTRKACAHGLAIWFDAELAPGIGYSNAPDAPELIYAQAFFPLERALAVEPGDSVSVEIRADPGASDYLWTWNTDITSRGRGLAHFRQSTFHSDPLPSELVRVSSGQAPGLYRDEGPQ